MRKFSFLIVAAVAGLFGCAGSGLTNPLLARSASGAQLYERAEIWNLTIDTPLFKRRAVNRRCLDQGGTWKLAGFGKKFGGVIQYGENSCPSKKVGLFTEIDGDEGWPVPSGYNFAFLIGFGFGNDTFTWQGSDLTGTITSSLIDAGKSYSVFVYDGNMNLLSEQHLGTPSNQTLVFSSPFEGGFTFDGNAENYVLGMEFATPSEAQHPQGAKDQ